MWRRYSTGKRFAKTELNMLYWCLEGFGGKVLVMMMVGVGFLRLFRLFVGMCVGILASGTGAIFTWYVGLQGGRDHRTPGMRSVR